MRKWRIFIHYINCIFTHYEHISTLLTYHQQQCSGTTVPRAPGPKSTYQFSKMHPCESLWHPPAPPGPCSALYRPKIWHRHTRTLLSLVSRSRCISKLHSCHYIKFYLAMSISRCLSWFEANSQAKVSNHSSQISPEQHILTLKVPDKRKSVTQTHYISDCYSWLIIYSNQPDTVLNHTCVRLLVWVPLIYRRDPHVGRQGLEPCSLQCGTAQTSSPHSPLESLLKIPTAHRDTNTLAAPQL